DPPPDPAQSRDHAVGGKLRILGVGERAVLDEAVGVEQQLHALAREQLPALGVLLVVLRRPALLDPRQLRLHLVVEVHRAALLAECATSRNRGWSGNRLAVVARVAGAELHARLAIEEDRLSVAEVWCPRRADF